MADPLEITHLLRHDVRGEERWTGRLTMPGRGSFNVLVVPVQDRLVAFQLRCPHMDRDLTRGAIMDCRAIECPSHGWVIPLTELGGREVHAGPDGRPFAAGPFVPPPEGDDTAIGDPRDGG